ncbi:hypothetical protein JCM8097_004692 [Rhodosporidiobolus ruineniae]
MSQSTAGPCLVCGEETASRCEACRQAGIDLFFCSREHQKLLWPVHKKVCGPGKANPSTWPALSTQEQEEVVSLLEHEQEDCDVAALVDILNRKGYEGQMRFFVNTLDSACTLHNRETLFSATHPTVDHVFRPAAQTALRAIGTDAIYTSGVLPSWWSAVHHLLLAKLGLAYAFRLAPSSETAFELDKLLGGALRRFLEATSAAVRSTNAEQADAFLAIYQRAFEKHAAMEPKQS